MTDAIKKINKKLLSVYLIIAFFAFWEIAPKIGIGNPAFFPPFSKVLGSANQITYSEIIINILTSLKRILIGYSLAIIFGLPFGFLLGGAFPRIEKFFKSLFVFLSNVPPFILSPIIIIIYGIGEGAINFVILWAAFWPVMFTTIAGVRQVNPLYIRGALSMGANKVTIFTKVILPGALSSIITGMKTGLTMSFIMLIGAETLGSHAGLGFMIYNSQLMGQVPQIFFSALLILALGLLISYLFDWIEKKAIVWKEPTAD